MFQDAHAIKRRLCFSSVWIPRKVHAKSYKFFKQLGKTFIEILNHIFKNEIMGHFDEITAKNVTISCCAEIF